MEVVRTRVGAASRVFIAFSGRQPVQLPAGAPGCVTMPQGALHVASARRAAPPGLELLESYQPNSRNTEPVTPPDLPRSCRSWSAATGTVLLSWRLGVGCANAVEMQVARTVAAMTAGVNFLNMARSPLPGTCVRPSRRCT